MSELPKVKIGALAVLLLTACAMPSTRIYSLYFPVEVRKTQSVSHSSLVVILRSARYLEQPYIAYRTSPYQLEISSYAKWDAAPSEIVRDAFRDSLTASGEFKEVRASRTAQEGFYSLEVYLKAFERIDTEEGPFGDVAFDVRLISPEGEELYRGEISRKSRLGDRSFLSLAKTLSSGLLEAMEEVKGHLARVVPLEEGPAESS